MHTPARQPNGGFTYTDGDNGSADNGRTNEPLHDGKATLIGYRDGRIAIVTWSGGPDVGPDVAWARQRADLKDPGGHWMNNGVNRRPGAGFQASVSAAIDAESTRFGNNRLLVGRGNGVTMAA